jgi:uncharacterized FAD-dependent dehydrogenase
MIRIAEIRLPLDCLDPADSCAHPVAALRAAAAERLGLAAQAIARVTVFKRSLDARRAHLLAVYIVDVALADPAQEIALLSKTQLGGHIQRTPDMDWWPPVRAPADWAKQCQGVRPVVVGFGPCGLFAALTLAQMGFAPIVLERGKPVRQRTRDTWGLWRRGVLDPESNVQFGEGGAGLFSDGKLYSQIRDPRHLSRKVLTELVQAGAPEEILWAAHPHVGTFRLVKVVQALRARITALGGEIRFRQRVVDLLLESVEQQGEQTKTLSGLVVEDIDTGSRTGLPARHMVLALGHSARDTFVMLHQRGVAMAAKPFSIGARIEHPQSLIDRARWGRHAGRPLLGAADYRLAYHAANGRTAYSFCMCPGGTVVAATSEAGRVVTNGMSQYSRAERNANAALVVGLNRGDLPAVPAAFEAAFGASLGVDGLPVGQVHPLAGIALQRELEARAFRFGGSDYCAPAQRVGDFLAGRAPATFVQWGDVIPSYQPGVRPADLRQALPDWVCAALAEALLALARQIPGFDLPDAVLTGVETRTSSPVIIQRNDENASVPLQSSNVRGLYPAGEGAGYAGGILSAGVDGIRVGEAVARVLMGRHDGDLI